MNTKPLLTIICAIIINSTANAQTLSVNASQDTSLCQGSTTSLSAAASGGNGGPYTFTWMPGNLSGSTITVSPSNTTTYTVTVNDGINTASDTVRLYVYPRAVVFLNVSATSGCEFFTTQFLANSNIGISYSWNFGDGSVQTGQNVSHTYVNSGTYNLTLTTTTAMGCTTTLTNINYISVYSYPTASFSISQTTSNTFSFNDQSIGATKWDWDFGDGTSDTVQNPVHTFSGNGNYAVRLAAQNNYGCSDTLSLAVVVDAIHEYDLNSTATIFPNPIETSATFELLNPDLDLKNTSLHFFNILGKEISKLKINTSKTIIEKGYLNSGIYFYRVMDGNQIISSGKLIIQ